MRTKIAIITTEFLREFITNTFESLDLDMETSVFIYHSYKDIEVLYRTIPDEYEGVLTSGIFPAAIIQKCYPNTKRIISYFNTDDAAIYRLFLQRFIEEGAVDLDRVYGDFVEIFGIGLTDYLTKDQQLSYTNLIEPKVLAMSVEEICRLEEEQLRKHMRLHEQGQVDFSVTRFSSIAEPVKKHGYKIYFPYPGKEFIRTIAEKLRQDIAMRHMEENRPAVINVSVVASRRELHKSSSFQLNCLSLQEALLKFQGGSSLDYVLQQTNTGFEILTNQKKLSIYTKNFSCCNLSAYLKKHVKFTVAIGYGIGKDIYQARMNAIYAERESYLHHNESFLMNEEELIGPLSVGTTVTASVRLPESVKKAAETISLSPLTISKVMAAFDSMAEKQLTASDLANKLSITKRSANRFLSAMHEAGMIYITAQKRATSRGRPERVYAMTKE